MKTHRAQINNGGVQKTMEDKELKRRLKKIPDVDKNGDPIYKIDAPQKEPKKSDQKPK